MRAFLVATKLHYERVYPSVGQSVHPSIGWSFEGGCGYNWDWTLLNPNPHGLLNDLFPTGGADSARALGTIVDGLLILPNCA